MKEKQTNRQREYVSEAQNVIKKKENFEKEVIIKL